MENKITVQDFLENIQKSYGKYFTDSRCVVGLNKSLYRSISVRCLLSNNNSEVASGIWQNDMFSVAFMIDIEGKEFDKDITLDSEIPKNLELKVLDNSYLIKPQDKYLCYSSRKLRYRKTKGDATKILSTLDKYFKKLNEELKKDIDNKEIHDKHIELLKSKII